MSPRTLTACQIEVLLSHLPGVRDGDVDAVHDARVATRRLRELLPLTAVESGVSTRQTAELVRDTGRALGSLRDLDVLMALCRELADAHPDAAGPLAVARGRLQLDRHKAARRLVKRLEQVDVRQLRDVVHAGRPFLTRTTAWRTAFAEQLAARATKLGAAVVHASGVYMPNRLHRVRVHLKKLRYLAEIAEETGIWRPAHLRRDAARVQDVLGEIHDRQALLDELERRDGDPLLTATLQADIALRHARYLAQRARVEAMVAACCRFAGHERGRRRRFVSAMAVLVPAGFALLGTSSVRRRHAA